MPIFSQLNPKVELAEDTVALSIIRSGSKELGIMPPRHAMLAIESIENEKYKAVLTDLIGPYTHFENPKAVVESHWGHTDKTEVRVINVKENTDIRYYKASHTWIKTRNETAVMLKEINDEHDKIRETPAFYLMGGNSILSYLSNYQRHGKPARNCIHWVLDKLRLAGINLHIRSNNIVTDSKNFVFEDVTYHEESYSLRDLCEFIKLDSINGIRQHFPANNPKMNINDLVKWENVGSVELQLRHYTPLMLACGYGRWDIAKMLINEYGANVDLTSPPTLSGRFFKNGHLALTALDCAEQNIFGITNITKPVAGKEEVIQLLKDKMYRVPHKNVDVALPF